MKHSAIYALIVCILAVFLLAPTDAECKKKKKKRKHKTEQVFYKYKENEECRHCDSNKICKCYFDRDKDGINDENKGGMSIRKKKRHGKKIERDSLRKYRKAKKQEEFLPYKE